MEFNLGDILTIRRSPGGKPEDVQIDDIVASLDNEKLGVMILLSPVMPVDPPVNHYVGIFMLKLWLEWAA